MTRIVLFVLTNLAIIVTLGITTNLLGINNYIEPHGINLNNLLVFAAIFGFGGAFISLMISKIIAKWSMRLKIINGNESPEAAWLIDVVKKYSRQMKIAMPEVAIYDSPVMNAFATGPSKNNALVAVSSGLLNGMRKDEIEAVIGHEISHIANGDMVTSTLLQGVLNTFVIFIARIIGFAIDKMFSNNENNNESPGIAYMISVIVLEIFFGILASIVVAYHSRRREFAADRGGAKLASKQAMINALYRLSEQDAESALSGHLKAFGIFGGKNKFLKLLATHPPIKKRIEALESLS